MGDSFQIDVQGGDVRRRFERLAREEGVVGIFVFQGVDGGLDGFCVAADGCAVQAVQQVMDVVQLFVMLHGFEFRLLERHEGVEGRGTFEDVRMRAEKFETIRDVRRTFPWHSCAVLCESLQGGRRGAERENFRTGIAFGFNHLQEKPEFVDVAHPQELVGFFGVQPDFFDTAGRDWKRIFRRFLAEFLKRFDGLLGLAVVDLLDGLERHVRAEIVIIGRFCVFFTAAKHNRHKNDDENFRC